MKVLRKIGTFLEVLRKLSQLTQRAISKNEGDWLWNKIEGNSLGTSINAAYQKDPFKEKLIKRLKSKDR